MAPKATINLQLKSTKNNANKSNRFGVSFRGAFLGPRSEVNVREFHVSRVACIAERSYVGFFGRSTFLFVLFFFISNFFNFCTTCGARIDTQSDTQNQITGFNFCYILKLTSQQSLEPNCWRFFECWICTL